MMDRQLARQRLLQRLVELDEEGRIKVDCLSRTSVPGIFAAGDVRCGSVKRVAAAVGEGSIAVQFIHQYLADR